MGFLIQDLFEDSHQFIQGDCLCVFSPFLLKYIDRNYVQTFLHGHILFLYVWLHLEYLWIVGKKHSPNHHLGSGTTIHSLESHQLFPNIFDGCGLKIYPSWVFLGSYTKGVEISFEPIKFNSFHPLVVNNATLQHNIVYPSQWIELKGSWNFFKLLFNNHLNSSSFETLAQELVGMGDISPPSLDVD